MEINVNIFEQYGGYEVVKQAIANYKQSGDMVTAAGLKLQCLEYRRKHNIFEVGDKVVLPYTNYRSDTFELTWIFKETCDEKGIAYRHATDEEIKTGRRL